jgi:hypothetical protein
LRIGTPKDWTWQATGLLAQFAHGQRSRSEYDYHDEVEFALLFDTPGALGNLAARSVRTSPSARQHALRGSLRWHATGD